MTTAHEARGQEPLVYDEFAAQRDEELPPLPPDTVLAEALPPVDDVIRADDELAMAREVARVEMELWRMLLSFGPAVEVIIGHLGTGFDALVELELLRREACVSETPRSALVEAAAHAAWEHDVDRVALRGVLEILRRAFEGEVFGRSYLADVARAWGAHVSAKNRFVRANMPLVVSMARRFDRGLLSLEDLIQEGHLGLMRAVERFDHRRGYRFSTYAGWWIRHGFHRAMADKARLVRIPVHTYDEARRVSRVANAVRARDGADPTDEVLARAAGVSTDRVDFLREHARTQTPLSLDARRFEDGPTTLGDTLAAEEGLSRDEVLDIATADSRVADLFGVLSPLEADIIRGRFGLDGGDEITLRELGERHHLSRERIRQIQEAALLKMRAAMAQHRGSLEREDEPRR